MLHSQNQKFHTKFALKNSISTQKDGMIVLGSWATSNIISGTIGYYISDNSSRYFHQMNTAWNLVNLGIAGFGYKSASETDLNLEHDAALDKMQSFDKMLLINSGLDMLYIGSGALLWNHGIDIKSDRSTGYGKSIVLQGSFLLLFDISLYLIHRRYAKNLGERSTQLTFTGNGFLLSF
ncbi:MAG: hypothetical protein RIE52_06325 [Balneola sp.]|jgi:hypothetical protein